MTSRKYDVIVLGGGYVGSLAALVLSRKGYSVAVVERAAQPKFSVGESVSSEQDRIHLVLAHEFNIPELAPLSSYTKLKKQGLAIATWPREALYFLLSDEGPRSSDPREIVMQSRPWPVGPDYHCMRGEYDLHLLTEACKYGAHYLGMAEVREIDVADGLSCKVETSDGSIELYARFFVDASGPNSVLARRLGIAMYDPDESSLRSRSIFSHFINVRRVENLYGKFWKPVGIPRDNATVHCVWDGGWAWIIPFENGVTSVGVTLDMTRDRLDHDKMSAAGAFWTVVRNNEYLSALLDGACSIRPYERSGQIQRQAERMVGDNWVILPPAAGLSDPLLSPGNAVAANAVGRLAWGIDAILRDGRPGRDVLDFMQRRFFLEFEFVRKVQHVFFESFYNLEVFRESCVLFPMAVKLGVATKPEADQAPGFQVSWGFGNKAFRNLTEEVHEVVTAGRKANIDPVDLAARVRRTIHQSDPTGFARSFGAAFRTPTVHFNRLFPLLMWSYSLRKSADTGIAAASEGAVTRILGQIWVAIRLKGVRKHSFLPLILRQIWIQWSGNVGRAILATVSGWHRRVMGAD